MHAAAVGHKFGDDALAADIGQILLSGSCIVTGAIVRREQRGRGSGRSRSNERVSKAGLNLAKGERSVT